MAQLTFRPLDLTNTRDLTIRFREDSSVASFGDAEKFYEVDGKGDKRYITWLKEKIAKDPNSVVHVFDGDNIVGQIEMARIETCASNCQPNKQESISVLRKNGLA